MIVAKMDGKIVEVVRVADTVRFSEDRGWVCICTDFHVRECWQQNFKWVPATTRFDWVREFNFA
jgi:hypothetical protein